MPSCAGLFLRARATLSRSSRPFGARRPARPLRGVRATSAFPTTTALTALALVLAAAGTACADPPRWLTEPPAGCAVGAAGRALHVDAAYERALTDAREELASALLHVRVRSLDVEVDHQLRSAWLLDAAGTLPPARLAGFARLGASLFVLVCLAGAEPDVPAPPGVPAWVARPPAPCALGVAGPALSASRQEDAALRRGEAELARAGGGAVALVTGETPAMGVTTAARMSGGSRPGAARRRWLDRHGSGPTGLANTLYLLVCPTKEAEP